MQDLALVLEELERDAVKSKRPLTRRFIVVEGLYQNYGDLVPLPALLELKRKYKYRVIMDESMSVGVLGARGAGVTDHYGVPATDVEIIAGSCANVLSSSGGFCTGTKEVTDHQRLSGAAYCYSAALPPMMAVASIESLKLIETDAPKYLKPLTANILAFRNAFR